MSAPAVDSPDSLSRFIPSRTVRGFVVAVVSGIFFTLLQYLAHEAGHAMYKPGGYVGMDGKTREQYIDGNSG